MSNGRKYCTLHYAMKSCFKLKGISLRFEKDLTLVVGIINIPLRLIIKLISGNIVLEIKPSTESQVTQSRGEF